jgi:hypothetical protein
MKTCFRLLAFPLFALLFTGCVQISGQRTAPDGSSLSISANRFLWMSQNMEFTTEAEGVKVSLKAEKSSSDTAAVEALANIATTAISKAPGP